MIEIKGYYRGERIGLKCRDRDLHCALLMLQDRFGHTVTDFIAIQQVPDDDKGSSRSDDGSAQELH
jgi:hypothetical protein